MIGDGLGILRPVMRGAGKQPPQPPDRPDAAFRETDRHFDDAADLPLDFQPPLDVSPSERVEAGAEQMAQRLR